MVTIRCAMLSYRYRVEDEWLVLLACRTPFTSNRIKMVTIDRKWNDGLNLRPGGTTRGKWSIFEWECQGEGCGYSRLPGGSPRLCRLSTIHSGPLNEHLIMYCLHAGFMGSSKPT
jgi:hypothetical protein